MKKGLLLVFAVALNTALFAQFKIEKVAYFSWNQSTQTYSTDTFQKFVINFENGAYAGYDRYYTNNTKRQSYKSKLYPNGVNDINIFQFGTQMYPLEYIESDKVGANWENKRKYEYVRDSTGAVVEFYMYNYVGGNWDILLGHKYETYKTGNVVDSVIRYIKTSGTQFNWIKSTKNIYEYTGSVVTRIIGMIYWQENVADTNNIYYEIDWKDVDNRITPTPNNQRIGYLNGTLNSYKLRYNEKNSGTDPDNWVYYEYKMMYDGNDRIIEYESLGNWKYNYDYRSDGRQVSADFSRYNGSEWQIESGAKTIDIDDDDGNYELRHQQTYNQGIGDYVNNYLILFNGAPHLTSFRALDMPLAKVYPNPATDVIYIEVDKLESVEITDMTGRIIRVEPESGQPGRLNVSTLPEGIYIMKICADGQMYTSRVVKN